MDNTGNYGIASAGTSTITNSIIYGNDGDEIGSFTATVTNSLVEGGYTAVWLKAAIPAPATSTPTHFS